MPTINEIKEQTIVVRSVGDFTNAIQQISTMRMVQLRGKVLKSRPFVEAASAMLTEVASIRNSMDTASLLKMEKSNLPKPHSNQRAVIVITSNAGLTGSYNIEIYKKVAQVLETEKDSDFYIIGKKGQEYFAGGKFKVKNFPYEVPENFSIADLSRLVRVFDYYGQITLIYSRFINTATRDVVTTSIVNPVPDTDANDEKQPGKYTFEPGINELIEGISSKLRAALFQQQIFDAHLSQFAAQMVGMQTASDNAKTLLGELQLEYNKQRRKLIDKKISEVFAGSATWAS